MRIKLKSALIASAVILVTVVGVGYVYVFGFTYGNRVKDGVFTIHSENPISRIGANIVAFDTGSKWVLVDTHLGLFSGNARSKLKSIKDQPVAIAFNTHWHPDHSGGNASFTEEAEIIAHQNVFSILSKPHSAVGLTAPGSIHTYEAVSVAARPEIKVNARDTFEVNGKNFDAVHFPDAHSNGDLAIFARDFNVIALGDLIWPNGFPYVDLQNGGSAIGVSIAVGKILEASDPETIFIAGHGVPLTHADVTNYNTMLRETIKYVTGQHARGLSIEEVQADGLPQKWQAWASDLVPESEWIRMISHTIK